MTLRLLKRAAGTLLSVGVVLLVWQGLVKGFGLDPFVTRGPLDVLAYLADPTHGEQRRVLADASRETAVDAILGMVAGTVAGLLVAVAFALWRAVQQSLLPMALALRAVPLVAMAPLIALVFGRSLLGVTVIAGIVTFFPVLVNVSLAQRSVPPSSVDLIRAYGGGRFALMWRVQLPAALPALFAAMRIAAPLALVGALLAEWLSTGKGLGYLMLTSLYSFHLDQMWAAVAITTIASIILYAVISFVESVVLSRYSYPRS
jgi:ABC-type nitrate/sulfonate/bicarbonate transport system permease component